MTPPETEMTPPAHPGLQAYRRKLRSAIERDLERRARNRRRVAALAAPGTVAAAVAATLLFAGGAGGGTSAADAAILRHVSAALDAPAGSILHQRALVSLGNGAPHQFELWEETSAPYRYRVIKWGHEGTGTATHGVRGDPASRLRSMVQSGQAHVDATETYDGVPAYKLTVNAPGDTFLNGTAYVARSDYQPLEIDTTGGGGEVIRYQTYEYLPATATNQQLLLLPAQSHSLEKRVVRP
jgi:hypothetical protein